MTCTLPLAAAGGAAHRSSVADPATGKARESPGATPPKTQLTCERDAACPISTG